MKRKRLLMVLATACLVSGNTSHAIDYYVDSQANTLDLNSATENCAAKVVAADLYVGVPYEMFIPDANPPVAYNTSGGEFEGVFVSGVTGTTDANLTLWHRSVVRDEGIEFPAGPKILRKSLFMVDAGNLADNSGGFTIKVKPTGWGDLPDLPLPMFGTVTVVNPSTGKIYVFGGGCGNQGPWYNSTWVLDPYAGVADGWLEIPASEWGPEPRYFGSGIYDPNPSGDPRMVIYGGQTITENKYGDTWVINMVTNEWVQLPTIITPPNGPPPGVQHSAVYDPNPGGNPRMLVRNGDLGPTTHALNLATHEWTIIESIGGPGNRPLSPTQIYYPSEGNPQLLQFGGGYLSVYYDELWSQDLVTGEWTELPGTGPSGTPPGREGHVSAIDPITEKLTIWGGRTRTQDLDDLWYYNLIDQVWIPVEAPVANWPEARHVMSAAYDPTHMAFVITGGITLAGGECTDAPVCKVFITDYTDYDFPIGVEPLFSLHATNLNAHAWPNPTENEVDIRFSLNAPDHVTAQIVDVSGRAVRTLRNEVLPAGLHRLEWNRVSDQGTRMPAGTYFYKIRVGGEIAAGKVVLLD